MNLLICVTPPQKLFELNTTTIEVPEKIRLVYEYFDELRHFMQITFNVDCINLLDRFKNLLLHSIWKTEHNKSIVGKINSNFEEFSIFKLEANKVNYFLSLVKLNFN